MRKCLQFFPNMATGKVNEMEFLKTFLCGAGGAALVAGIFTLLKWWLSRRAEKQDDIRETKATTCEARGEEIKELTRMVGVLFLADRTILYERIKQLGKYYISRKYITVEELEDLERMHDVYHDEDKLNGNGFLKELMEAVRGLPKRAV